MANDPAQRRRTESAFTAPNEPRPKAIKPQPLRMFQRQVFKENSCCRTATWLLPVPGLQRPYLICLGVAGEGSRRASVIAGTHGSRQVALQRKIDRRSLRRGRLKAPPRRSFALHKGEHGQARRQRTKPVRWSRMLGQRQLHGEIVMPKSGQAKSGQVVAANLALFRHPQHCGRLLMQ